MRPGLKAIRIHVGPDITVEVPSEELVEQLIEILKQGEAQEHQVGDPQGRERGTPKGPRGWEIFGGKM